MALAPVPVAAERSQGRPGRPALAAGAAVGVCLLVNVVDPNDAGALGLCPFKAMTGGLDCPGCGALRATRALTRGNPVLAADHNLVFVLLVPLLLWGLLGWWRAERGARPHPPRVPATAALAVGWALPAWWVLRNLDAFAWFASGAA